MYEERESDVPDWEAKDVEIPESLKKKWGREEAEGIRAGLCAACGWPYTKVDLSCCHCGRPTEISGGVLVGLRRWFFKTRLGVLALIFILLGIILFICVVV